MDASCYEATGASTDLILSRVAKLEFVSRDSQTLVFCVDFGRSLRQWHDSATHSMKDT